MCVLEVGAGAWGYREQGRGPWAVPRAQMCGVTVWPLHGSDGGSPPCLSGDGASDGHARFSSVSRLRSAPGPWLRSGWGFISAWSLDKWLLCWNIWVRLLRSIAFSFDFLRVETKLPLSLCFFPCQLFHWVLQPHLAENQQYGCKQE